MKNKIEYYTNDNFSCSFTLIYSLQEKKQPISFRGIQEVNKIYNAFVNKR